MASSTQSAERSGDDGMTDHMVLTEATAEAAVLGGAVLGGGGGGSMIDGLEMARLAVKMGDVRLVPLDAITDQETLLTVSAVGAPAAKERYVRPAHYLRAVELFRQQFGVQPGGLMTNECGGNATVNGWLQSAALGLPLIDAACNGRAHPTGVMGSIGLHIDKNYVSRQVAVGGNPRTGRYLEVAASGSLSTAAGLVRDASIQAGGLVVGARNPVTASYAKQHAAAGAISQCIGLGEAMLAALAKSSGAAIEAAASFLRGQIAVTGCVSRVTIETRGGFDVGLVVVDGAQGRAELTFWNEYMTLEIDGQRLATFPDLLTTLDLATGQPISTAGMKEGLQIAVLQVPRQNLLLGAGMRDPELFAVAEQAVGKPLVAYVF
jgi:DUF917 family protein